MTVLNMFKQESQKGTFLEQTKAAREERAREKKRENAAIKIQANFRGFLAKRKFCRSILEEFDKEFNDDPKVENLKPALQQYRIVYRFLMIWEKERDKERFEKLCRYIVVSLDAESIKNSYVGVALNKEYSVLWISHIKNILWKCCDYLEDLRPEVISDTRSILLLLHTLVAFTANNTWAILRVPSMSNLRSGMSQLCANIMGHLVMRGFYITLKTLLLKGLSRAKICLTHVSLSAVMTLAVRPLISSGYTDKLISMFLIHVFSIPALVQHLQNLSPECITVLLNAGFLNKSLELLSSDQDMRIVFNILEGNYALCLLANIIHLAYIEKDSVLPQIAFPTFTMVITKLMESCQHYVVTKQSNLTHWHPVLGWFAQAMDSGLQDAISNVKQQLFLLWSNPITTVLLASSLHEALQPLESPCDPVPPPSINIIK